jgi:hypothetical protein
MKKLLLCVAVACTCLIPPPKNSEAALPCNSSYCCEYGDSARCMYYPGVWTTCGWYRTNINNSICP